MTADGSSACSTENEPLRAARNSRRSPNKEDYTFDLGKRLAAAFSNRLSGIIEARRQATRRAAGKQAWGTSVLQTT
jgi:hypothetical protein